MPKLFDTRAAAQHLDNLIPGESIKYWTLRLNNLRRADRPQPFKLGFAKVEGKSGYYAEGDLTSYVEFEKARRTDKAKLTGRSAELVRAFGIGESGGGIYGRKLACTVMLGLEENDANKQFVRLMIERPLSVFRLEADEAAGLAEELLDVVAAIKRHEFPQSAETTINTKRLRREPAARMVRLKGPK